MRVTVIPIVISALRTVPMTRKKTETIVHKIVKTGWTPEENCHTDSSEILCKTFLSRNIQKKSKERLITIASNSNINVNNFIRNSKTTNFRKQK